MGGGQPGVKQQLNYGPYYRWGGGNAQIWNATTEKGHMDTYYLNADPLL